MLARIRIHRTCPLRLEGRGICETQGATWADIYCLPSSGFSLTFQICVLNWAFHSFVPATDGILEEIGFGVSQWPQVRYVGVWLSSGGGLDLVMSQACGVAVLGVE